jgi:HEAT repeat protein
MPKLLKDLSHSDDTKRRAAAELLSGGDERAIYPLIRALQDNNPGVQDAAMRSLVSIGGEVTAYMVIPLLREDSYLRNTALIILREIGVETVPLLYSLLRDKDDDIRKFALDLLIDINQDVDSGKILPLLKDSNQNVRASAVRAAGLVMQKDAVPFLLDALKDEEWVCFSALEALAKIQDEAAVLPIVSLIESQSMVLRFSALEALGSIGSPIATGPLLACFSRADEMEKREIVKSLVRIGATPSMAGISGILVDMLKNSDWDEKMIALKGIVALGLEEAITDIVDMGGSLDPSAPESEERLDSIREALLSFGCKDALVGCLENPSIRFRGRVLAIGLIGELRCRDAVPSLVKLIEGNLRDVRRASVRALGEMSNSGELQVFQDTISDNDSHVRKVAIEVLGRIGGNDSFELLLKLLSVEKYRDVLEEIVKALIILDQQTLCGHAGEFNATLRELLARHVDDQNVLISLAGDDNQQVRVAAIAGLGRIGSDAAIVQLRQFVKDPDRELRKAAVTAMGELGCCYDYIRAALNDEDMWVRLHAVKALGSSEDPANIEALMAGLNDREMPVVLSTIDAVARIGGREAFSALACLEDHDNPVIREKAVQTLESL